MDKKKFAVIAFVIVALVQLFVPAKMIFNRENILETGKEFKFKTAPIDPNDPFRGKYIRLSFEDVTVPIASGDSWAWDEEAFISLTIDEDGFAKISSVSKIKPTDNPDFVKAKVSYPSGTFANKISIVYPFDRYYLEESKASEAERTYTESQRDTTKITYALVNIKNGDAVLKDVVINGKSIKDLIKAR